jgi:hypothetical protein
LLSQCPLWVLVVSKRFARRGLSRATRRKRAIFPTFDYAWIAAISG